jgi:hypothetical protein
VALLVLAGLYGYETWHAWDTGRPWALIVPLAVLGALTVVAVPAMALGHRFGWIMAVTITGWGLAFALIVWFTGNERYALMGFLALLAFLLHTPEMRTAYGIRTGSSR